MCHDGVGHHQLQDVVGIEERDFTVDTSGVAMPVFEARPEGQAAGNVIIIHDIYGPNTFYHDLARRLAKAGFCAWLPDLFVRVGPLPEYSSQAARARGQKLPYPQAMRDLARLVDELGEDASTGIVGFCMGGTLTMLLAAHEPRLKAGVIYYGFPANPNPSENRPAQPFDEAEYVGMPLLGFWGDKDAGVGMENVERYRALLEEHDKDFEFHIYPGCGHGFLTFDPDDACYDASQESWERALVFFGERL